MGLLNALLNSTYPPHPVHIVNVGVSGNTVRDLEARWQTDVLHLEPDGTVPDVLNRSLRKLAEDGMIRVERHQIQILDKEGLKAIAQVIE